MEDATRDTDAQVNNQKIRYNDVRRAMEERFSEYDPENLALILANQTELTEPTSRIILDVFLLLQFQNQGGVSIQLDEEVVPIEAEENK